MTRGKDRGINIKKRESSLEKSTKKFGSSDRNLCLSDEPIFRGMIILKSVIGAMLTRRLMSRLGLLWLFSDISQNTAVHIQNVVMN